MPYSASAMFVTHGIPSFYELLRKYIYNFSERISSSSNPIINPFLTRFFAITSPIKTVFFDNSVTLKTVIICVYRTNWMCHTKTSVVQ